MNGFTRVVVTTVTVVVAGSCSSPRKILPPVDDPAVPPRTPGQEHYRPIDDPPRPPSKREYIGLSRREAALKAWAAGQSFRIVEVNGRREGDKGPRQSGRLNFTIRNDVVVKVTKG